MAQKENITGTLDRAERLLGSTVMEQMATKRVIVFGVGGVGSWCVESLVRTGIRQMTIVDSDRVCASNVNRQLMATTTSIGRPKVEVLKERLLDIAPDAQVDARMEVFNAETAHTFRLDDYDYIVDAIDSLADKMLLIRMATQTKAVFFSSMGAALKQDPTKIQVAEFWKVRGCPLARALRQRFKKEKTFPSRKFTCVFSEELLKNQPTEQPAADRGNGSLVQITGIFGFTLAGLVINDIARRAKEA